MMRDVVAAVGMVIVGLQRMDEIIAQADGADKGCGRARGEQMIDD